MGDGLPRGVVTVHEFSLMQRVMDLVTASAAEHGLTRVTRLHLVVGELTAALPEALQAAFTALSRGTAAEGAVLEIEERPLLVRCGACGREYRPDLPVLTCPAGHRSQVHILQGRELYLDSFEGEDEDEGCGG